MSYVLTFAGLFVLTWVLMLLFSGKFDSIFTSRDGLFTDIFDPFDSNLVKDSSTDDVSGQGDMGEDDVIGHEDMDEDDVNGYYGDMAGDSSDQGDYDVTDFEEDSDCYDVSADASSGTYPDLYKTSATGSQDLQHEDSRAHACRSSAIWEEGLEREIERLAVVGGAVGGSQDFPIDDTLPTCNMATSGPCELNSLETRV